MISNRFLFLFSYLLVWLLFFEASRLLFVVWNSLCGLHLLSVAEYGQAVASGLRLDLSASAYLTVFPALCMVLDAFDSYIPPKLIKAYTSGMLLLLSLLTAADLPFYEHLGYRLDITPLFYLGKSVTAIRASVTATELCTALLITGLLFAAFGFLFRKLIERFARLKLHGGRLPFMLISLPLLFLLMRGGWGLAPVNVGSACFSSRQHANNCAINMPWNMVYALSEYRHQSLPAFMSDDECVTRFNRLHVFADTALPVLRVRQPNIALIVLESFSGRLIGYRHHGIEITPCMNRLVAEGIYFSRMYASGDRTDKGIPAILSAYPAQPTTSIINEHRKAATLPSLIKVLGEQGFETHFCYAGDIDFSNFRSYFAASGLKHLYTEDHFAQTAPRGKWGVHDGAVFDTLLRQVQFLKSPFFCGLLTITNHEPFETPDAPLFAETDDESRFMNTAHYTDSCLGKWIAEMKKTPVWDSLLIIITSDHGHYYPGNVPYVHPDRFLSPMLWLGGAIASPARLDYPVSHTDLANTLLQQLGFSERFPFGSNMFAKAELPSAFYCFNNGFGFVTGTGFMVYDNKAQRFIDEQGDINDEQRMQGKACLQKLMSDYRSR